jgi:HEAT repeat protein
MQSKEQNTGSNMNKELEKAGIDELVANLASKDGFLRIKSRHALIARGEPAIEPLVDAMSSKNEYVRWEATKAIGQIAAKMVSRESTRKEYQDAVQKLVEALEDKNFDVRWLAAEGLTSIGEGAVRPILNALVERSDSLILREGAHHVFHDLLAKGILSDKLVQVTMALEDINSPVEIPFMAKSVLESI